MICENCKSNIPDTARFCPKCGNICINKKNEDASTKQCPQCGAENPVSAKFCKIDGYKFTETEEKTVKTELVAKEEKDILICPVCGREYSTTTKFCKKDGTALIKKEHDEKEKSLVEESIKAEPGIKREGGEKGSKIVEEIPTVPQAVTADVLKEIETETEPIKRGSKKLFLIVAVIVILIAAGAGGYLYLSGYIGDTPEKLKDSIDKESTTIGSTPERLKDIINKELTAKGFNVTVDVDKDWAVNVRGDVKDNNDKSAITDIVKSHNEVKSIIDSTHIASTVTETPKSIKSAVSAKPREVKQVPIDPAKLEGKINRALRNAGLTGITAEVKDDMSITLKGTAKDAYEKQKALEIVKGFKGVKNIKDVIFVIVS